MTNPIRIKDPNSAGRQYTFTLSFGGMAALLTALALSLSLFFVLGVLVGRGHRPEAAVPVVAGIMPKDGAAKPAAAAVPAPSPEVLKPEELGYNEQLAKKHEGPAPSRPIDKVERKAPEKKDDKAAKKDEKAAKAADKGADKSAEKKDEKRDAKAKAEQKPDPDTQRYDYAYQAASFPDPEQAKAFLKRVKGLGLKADIESGNKDGKPWNRVVVFFQGTPTDTRGLKEKLGSLGVKQPLLRSKTPI